MKKVNLLKLTGAVLSLSLMMYFLVSYINPQNASAEENVSEIRGIWVATVFGLDYPSGYTDSEKDLKKRIDDVMETSAKAGFNTVFFQVRPACDAFYKSDIFPWSRYLTGEQGKAPENGFDPLEYAVSSAHKHSMKLHAWINPYRVTVSAGDEKDFDEKNPAKIHSEYTICHTDGKMYLDPGNPEVTKLIADGAREIVKNYRVDGIHIDDYFYPDGNFADGESYAKYGNGKSLEDWRRDNVTEMVKALSEAVHNEKADVVFSVSPSGIWANKKTNSNGSATSGSESYVKGFADTRRWVKEEIIDWIIPQIYWNQGYEIADFNTLVKWWKDTTEGTKVKLCIGLAAYKASDANDPQSPWYGEQGIEELRSQIDFCRLMKTEGYAMYRYGSVASKKGIFEMTEEINKTEEPSEIFTDIKDFPWAKDAVKSLYEKEIIKGMGDGSFGGHRQVSRADFTVMLLRTTKETADFKENFDDVLKTDYFYEEIGAAKALGIAGGLGDNKFAPKENISRQDMAVMVYRILKEKGKAESAENGEISFTDSEQIKDYAKEAVAVLSQMKIINGYEDGSFKPLGNATRAETAVVIDKVQNLLGE